MIIKRRDLIALMQTCLRRDAPYRFEFSENLQVRSLRRRVAQLPDGISFNQRTGSSYASESMGKISHPLRKQRLTRLSFCNTSRASRTGMREHNVHLCEPVTRNKDELVDVLSQLETDSLRMRK